MTKENRNRKGGGHFPMRFFRSQEFGNYYPAGSPEISPGNSAYGPIIPKSYGMRTGSLFPHMVGPNLAATRSTPIKTGGGNNPYNSIVNPFTGRKCSIFSDTGRKVLSYYIDQLEE